MLKRYYRWPSKILLTESSVKFIYSKDNDEEQVIHSESENIEVIDYDKVNEVMKEIVEPNWIQTGLEK